MSSSSSSIVEPVSLWVKDPVHFGRESNILVQLGSNDGEVSSLVTRDGIVVASSLTDRGPDNTQAVRFLPDEPGDYRVSVFHNGQEVANAIFSVHPDLDADSVHCSGQGLEMAEVNHEASFHIHVDPNVAREQLSVKIIAPSGNSVTSDLRESSEHLVAEYRPREVGDHHLEVRLAGSHVHGSPFEVPVFDPSHVDVSFAPSLAHGQKSEFTVDVGRAQRVPVECFVQRPSGTKQALQRLPRTPDQSHSVHRFEYRPLTSGTHKVNVLFGGTELPNSPFLQTVEESKARAQLEVMSQPRVFGAGLEKAQVGVAAEFFVDPKGHKGDLSVQVDGPDSVAKCNIEPEFAGRYRVTYVPLIVGHYSVNINWNDNPLPHSPYRPIVVDKNAVECDELRTVSNNPLDPLIVGRKREVLVNTAGAGPGTLRATAVDALGGHVAVRTKKRSENQVAVTFTPKRPGVHKLSLFWSDICIPRTPLIGVAVNDPTVDHSKVILSGRGLKEGRVNEVSEFVIDGKHAGPGTPVVVMKGVRTEVEVKLESIMERRYRCTYRPEIAGAYLLSIWWNDRQLRGSPFKATIVAPSDAGKVVCNGDGLAHGILGGEPMECFIDTRSAGSGELMAHCTGPRKVAYCELFDRRDGTYIVKIQPQETGRHVLQIKYGGEHVHGSPFHPRISQAPDASKVRVLGPGVEHGVLGSFESAFMVETRGAGAGQLTVRVRGPRGGFRVEMERESHTDRSIVCRYDPSEAGEYSINVAWSGNPVPGSPFRVMLCNSESELLDYCRKHGLSPPQQQWQARL